MHTNDLIFRELLKRGYSCRGKTRVWDISDSKLWYLTPELSQGFLKLFKYEPYRKVVVETELRLLKKNCHKILGNFGKDEFNLVDLGCGGGTKTSQLIKCLPGKVRLRYVPIDISEYFIEKAVEKVKKAGGKKLIGIRPFVSEFSDLDEILGLVSTRQFRNNMILLLGETISHYEINDFLFEISKAMKKNDLIVIGNGYRVGKRFVNVQKYKNELFNEWFIHVVLALGFEKNEISYDARFANGRLEGFYRVLVDKKVKHAGKNVYFRKGDEIVVAIQYKFYERELKKFCKMYFKGVEFVLDKKAEYCLILCKK